MPAAENNSAASPKACPTGGGEVMEAVTTGPPSPRGQELLWLLHHRLSCSTQAGRAQALMLQPHGTLQCWVLQLTAPVGTGRES